MRVVLSSAPATEPVSLAEAKLHLRLDSGTFADNTGELQSLTPASRAVAADYTTHVGTAVEVLGYQALVILNSGTNGAGGTVDCKIQDSDDGAAWTDYSGGAFTQVTEANDNAIQELAYTGTKRYIRTVAKVLVADCVFGTTVIRFTPSTSEDSDLTDIIQAARENVEDICRRALITQTWDYYLDSFPPANAFKLPFGNLQSVTHIKYTDSGGTQSTMTATTEYLVETNGEYPGRIVLPYGAAWPSFTPYPSNPIVTRFICGWTAASEIPRKIKSAIKMIITDLYLNREARSYGSMDYRENPAVMRLLTSSRIWNEFI